MDVLHYSLGGRSALNEGMHFSLDPMRQFKYSKPATTKYVFIKCQILLWTFKNLCTTTVYQVVVWGNMHHKYYKHPSNSICQFPDNVPQSTVIHLICVIVVGSWVCNGFMRFIYTYPSGLPQWHWENRNITTVQVKNIGTNNTKCYHSECTIFNSTSCM